MPDPTTLDDHIATAELDLSRAQGYRERTAALNTLSVLNAAKLQCAIDATDAANVQAMFPGAVHFDGPRPMTALDLRAEADATARAAQDAANAARATGA